MIIWLLWPLVWLGQKITKSLKKDKEKSVLSRQDFSAMAAIGEKDRWGKGASCNTKTHARGSNSIVITDAPHGMSDRPEVGKAVDDFLLAVRAE